MEHPNLIKYNMASVPSENELIVRHSYIDLLKL